MNKICLHGKITRNAERILVNTAAGETPLVVFTVMDTGLPYQKNEPMNIEVHFIKEAANHVFEYLKKDKEVLIDGFLRQKNFLNSYGENKSKYYISAEFVTLLPLYK